MPEALLCASCGVFIGSVHCTLQIRIGINTSLFRQKVNYRRIPEEQCIHECGRDDVWNQFPALIAPKLAPFLRDEFESVGSVRTRGV